MKPELHIRVKIVKQFHETGPWYLSFLQLQAMSLFPQTPVNKDKGKGYRVDSTCTNHPPSPTTVIHTHPRK